MTPLSDSEAATVARFESTEPAPESWGGGLREAIARALRDDETASDMWDAPDVDFYNHAADAVLALPEIAALHAKAAAADRVRELADTYAFLGATLHDVPRAETWAEAATELRQALDALADPC